MESKTALEWLKSLHTLASILLCNWILERAPKRPADVTDIEEYPITRAIMANFRRKIPAELKVSLPINFDDDSMTPSRAYNTLIEHFSKPDPFLHDNFRSQFVNIAGNEKVANYMK